jgi:hypothetical protein
MAKKISELYQFKITLNDSKPAIWRRIVVPANYSFWDLHVAIQDSMGWLDYHLHEFEIVNPTTCEKVRIGLPDEEYDEPDKIAIPDHKENISDYFNKNNCIARYEYDFGDSWIHTIKFEKILLAIPGEKYPKCIGGKMACPPEDCGGIPGYYNLLSILKNPKNEEYEDMINWLGGEFDPKLFDPESVLFDNPMKRFKLMDEH